MTMQMTQEAMDALREVLNYWSAANCKRAAKILDRCTVIELAATNSESHPISDGELLSCPFCGAEAERTYNALFSDMSIAQCSSCGASAYSKKWNRRVTQSFGAQAMPEYFDEEAE